MTEFKKMNEEITNPQCVFKYYYVYNFNYGQNQQVFWNINEAIKYSVNNDGPLSCSLYEVLLYNSSDGEIYENVEKLGNMPNLANRSITDYILAVPREEGNPKYICGYMVYEKDDLDKKITLNNNFDKFENVALYRVDTTLNDNNISVTTKYTLLREIKKNGKIKTMTRDL